MKASLLNKEVLVIYDIRQVQRFLFTGSSTEEYEGANNIVSIIFHEAFNYCIHHPSVNLKKNEYNLDDSVNKKIPYLCDKKIKVQVIFIGGGNAIVLYRSGSLAQKINRLFSSYILHKTYSLEVAIAAVEKTNDFEYDSNNLYIELDHAKNNGAISLPTPGLAISSIEPSSGFPNTFINKSTGQYYSTVSKIKRGRLLKPIDLNLKKLLPLIYIGDSSKILSYNKICKNNPLLAFVKIDGNSMGIRIAQIKKGVKDYQKAIVVCRKIQRNIQSINHSVIEKTIKWFKNLLIKRKEKNPDLESHLLLCECGGDDINFVCDYHYAFSIVEYLVKQIEKTYLWKDKRLGTIPFSVCAGIAFCYNKIDDVIGHSLAEEFCKFAKNEAKKKENLINGAEGNWIYFQDCKIIQNSAKKSISQDFILSDGNNLCLRPYCLNKEFSNDVRHFSTFKKYYHLLEKANFKQQISSYLRRSYQKSEFYINTSLATLKEEGVKFPQPLNKTFIKVKGRSRRSALWFDALEMEGYFYDVLKK